MDFIVENYSKVLAKVSFEDAPKGPTIFSDALAAIARGKKKIGNESSGEDQFGSMRISDLRRRAHGKGLEEADGSKETLLAMYFQRTLIRKLADVITNVLPWYGCAL